MVNLLIKKNDNKNKLKEAHTIAPSDNLIFSEYIYY